MRKRTAELMCDQKVTLWQPCAAGWADLRPLLPLVMSFTRPCAHGGHRLGLLPPGAEWAVWEGPNMEAAAAAYL